MAKKRGQKVPATAEKGTDKPVRLVLGEDDHERLERQAKRLGLSKAAYARMALMRAIENDERTEDRD